MAISILRGLRFVCWGEVWFWAARLYVGTFTYRCIFFKTVLTYYVTDYLVCFVWELTKLRICLPPHRCPMVPWPVGPTPCRVSYPPPQLLIPRQIFVCRPTHAIFSSPSQTFHLRTNLSSNYFSAVY